MGARHSDSDSDARAAAAVAPVARDAACVDLPPAAVHYVRGVDGQHPLEGRGARVAGVRPAHLPPGGKGQYSSKTGEGEIISFYSKSRNLVA